VITPLKRLNKMSCVIRFSGAVAVVDEKSPAARGLKAASSVHAPAPRPRAKPLVVTQIRTPSLAR
jgi:hypothetical protein